MRPSWPGRLLSPGNYEKPPESVPYRMPSESAPIKEFIASSQHPTESVPYRMPSASVITDSVASSENPTDSVPYRIPSAVVPNKTIATLHGWELEITRLEGFDHKVIKGYQMPGSGQRTRDPPASWPAYLDLKDGDIFFVARRADLQHCWIWQSESIAGWTRASNYFPHPRIRDLFLCAVGVPMWTTEDVIDRMLRDYSSQPLPHRKGPLPHREEPVPHWKEPEQRRERESPVPTLPIVTDNPQEAIPWVPIMDRRGKRQDIMFGTGTEDLRHAPAIDNAPPCAVYVHVYDDDQRSYWLHGARDTSPWKRVQSGAPHPLYKRTVLCTADDKPTWMTDSLYNRLTVSPVPAGTDEGILTDKLLKIIRFPRLANTSLISSVALAAWRALDPNLPTFTSGKRILEGLTSQSSSSACWDQLPTLAAFGRTPSLEHVTQAILSALHGSTSDNVSQIRAGLQVALCDSRLLPGSFVIPSTSPLCKAHGHRARGTATYPKYHGTTYSNGGMRLEQGVVIRHEILICMAGSLLVFGWPLHEINRHTWTRMCPKSVNDTLYTNDFLEAINSMMGLHVNLISSGDSLLIPIGSFYSVLAFTTAVTITASFAHTEDAQPMMSLTEWISQLPTYSVFRNQHAMSNLQISSSNSLEKHFYDVRR